MRESPCTSRFDRLSSSAPCAVAVVISVVAAACGGSSTTGQPGTDASPDVAIAHADAHADAKNTDAGKADTGAVEAGHHDASAHDASTPTDSGEPVDAGRDSMADSGPTCAPYQALCGKGAAASCASIQVDPNNCGGCGKVCTSGTYCSEAACGAMCIGLTSTLCSGTCVDKQSDNKNCGACANACPAGQVCSGSACAATCGSAYATCGMGASAYCALTQLDPDNCGACGVVCTPGEVCSAGTCASMCSGMAATLCSGLCVDTASDDANCGACGTVCTAGMTCSSGKCTVPCTSSCPVGAPCTGGTECASGVCTAGSCAAATAVPTEQLITTSGMVTIPTGITQIRVVLVGGGGGGGAGHDGTGNAGGGAGGGQVAAGAFTVMSGASFAVTVGAGGAGGTPSTSATVNSGAAGGKTSFSTLISAVGGGGGGGGYYTGTGPVTWFGGVGGGSGGGAGGNGAYDSQGGNGGTGGASGGSSTLTASGVTYTASGGTGTAFPSLTSFITQVAYANGTGGIVTAPATTYNGGGGGGGLILAAAGGTAGSGGAAGTSTGTGGPGGAGYGAGGGGGTGSAGAGGAGNPGAVYVEYCGAGQTACSSGCVSFATDVNNCGGCGKACATGQTCDSGTCETGVTWDATASTATLTNGNLQASVTAQGGGQLAVATVGVSTGKWYWEITSKQLGGAYTGGGPDRTGFVGVGVKGSISVNNGVLNATTYGVECFTDATPCILGSGGPWSASKTDFPAGGVFGLALDMTAGTLSIYENCSLVGVAFTGLEGATLSPFYSYDGATFNQSEQVLANFGASAFACTPPAGFNPGFW